jgi:hypothetical protein
MNRHMLFKLGRTMLLLALVLSVGSCGDPRVYGSIGISSYGGGHPHVGGSISIGGRIR